MPGIYSSRHRARVPLSAAVRGLLCQRIGGHGFHQSEDLLSRMQVQAARGIGGQQRQQRSPAEVELEEERPTDGQACLSAR